MRIIIFSIIIYTAYFKYTVYPNLYKLIKETHSDPDAGNPFLLWDERRTLIMTLLSWAFRRSIYYHVFFSFGVCACSCFFQTHLGLSWTRYGVISVSAARLLVASVGCTCCKVHGNSRGESVDRPWQLIPATHLFRICACQQNMSATVVVGKSSHVFFGHRK